MIRLPSNLLCALVGVFWAAGCSDNDDNSTADLPEGWKDAAPIESFQQSACDGSPYEGAREQAEFSAASGRIRVSYDPAHFRCSQSVEGFVKIGDDGAAILVQPIDMNPSSVARCDCLYTIDLDFAVAPGRYEVTLDRRWDHKSGADEPLRIDTASLDVP
jgi:hypothetical protein